MNGGGKQFLLLWPFIAVLRILELALSLAGRIIAFILGLALVALGIVLMLTILGAPAGAIMVLLGFLLLVRSLF